MQLVESAATNRMYLSACGISWTGSGVSGSRSINCITPSVALVVVGEADSGCTHTAGVAAEEGGVCVVPRCVAFGYISLSVFQAHQHKYIFYTHGRGNPRP